MSPEIFGLVLIVLVSIFALCAFVWMYRQKEGGSTHFPTTAPKPIAEMYASDKALWIKSKLIDHLEYWDSQDRVYRINKDGKKFTCTKSYLILMLGEEYDSVVSVAKI